MIKTIQMTLDESLLQRIDQAVEEIGTNRSAFIREAVELALQQMRIRRLEAQQLAGYREQPVQADEIDEWDAIRVWGEA